MLEWLHLHEHVSIWYHLSHKHIFQSLIVAWKIYFTLNNLMIYRLIPSLNIITEYAMGLIYTGRPIASVCFKICGYMSKAYAVSFLSDFKVGHYMKIFPRSMFLVSNIIFLLSTSQSKETTICPTLTFIVKRVNHAHISLPRETTIPYNGAFIRMTKNCSHFLLSSRSSGSN